MRPFWRLVLPHHWTWPRLDPVTQAHQIVLDKDVRGRREWPPTDPEPELDALEPFVHGRVLELGAGTGQVTASLVAWADHVTALEPVARLWEQGASSVPATWVLHEWEAWVAPERFDTVVTAHMVHHECDRDELARWIGQHLVPGGVWVLLEPCHTWRRAARLAYWWWRQYRHWPWDAYGATHDFLTHGEVRRLARLCRGRVVHRQRLTHATLWVIRRG